MKQVAQKLHVLAEDDEDCKVTLRTDTTMVLAKLMRDLLLIKIKEFTTVSKIRDSTPALIIVPLN